MVVYKRKSPLVKVSNKSVKLRQLSDSMKKRLKKHRERHIKAGNPRPMVNKHMKVMRDLMKQKMSFSKSHIEAQKKYPMKN